MILVDTSIWVDHLRTGDAHLEQLLLKTKVLIHPYIIGELACGNLYQRDQVLMLLKALPKVSHARSDEVLLFIEEFQLMGIGVGWIDCHLLASAKLDTVPLWTRDKRLSKAAKALNIAYQYKN